MTNDDPKGLLAAVFTERPMPVLDAATRDERRRRAVSGIQAILAQPQPKRIRYVHRIPWGETAAVVALAAGLALVVGWLWPESLREAPVALFRATASNGEILCDRDDGKNWTACDPAKVAGVVGLRTLAGAGVTVETVAGVRLNLEASSTLLMTETKASASRVTLAEGIVDVKVPKLGPDRQFAVLTPSAVITVHGTAFSVEVKKNPNHASRTCVRLREGVVSIQSDGRDERLVAPGAWGCGDSAEAVAAASDVVVQSDVTLKNSGAPASSNGTRRPNLASLDRSTLAQETRLLQRALGAERRRDWGNAERNLKQLLSVYPDSVVAPEARAALERIAAQRTDKRHE